MNEQNQRDSIMSISAWPVSPWVAFRSPWFSFSL